MKKFREYIIEVILTNKQAMSILGLPDDWMGDHNSLKLAYRIKSKENHPDKGGNDEKMKMVNLAFQFLSKRFLTTAEPENDKTELIKYITDDVLSRVNVQEFIDYFNKIFNEPFKSTNKVTVEYSFIAFDYNFFNKDKSKFFSLSLFVNTNDAKGMSSLVNDDRKSFIDLNYQVAIESFSFVDNKKTNLTKNRWERTNVSNKFTNPDVVFPKKKIEAFSTRKISKRDIETFIVTNGGKILDKMNYIKLKDGFYVGLLRSVIMKQGALMVYGLYEKKREDYFTQTKTLPIITFSENEEIIPLFKMFIGMNSVELEKKLIEIKNSRK